MRFSDRLHAHMEARSAATGFCVGEWFCTLSGDDFTQLFRRIKRVMYLDEGEAPEDEVLDVLHLAVWAHQFETSATALLEPEDVERLALDLELATWLETARRKGLLHLDEDISIVAAGDAHMLVTADGVSHAVARAWSASARSSQEPEFQF